VRRAPVRIALVVVALAASVYGVASLTGGCEASRRVEPEDLSGTWTYNPAYTRTLAGLAPDAPLSTLLDLVPADSRDTVRVLVEEMERGYRMRLTREELIVEDADPAHPGSWRYRSRGRYKYESGFLQVWPTSGAREGVAAGRAPVVIVRVAYPGALVWPPEAWPAYMKAPFYVVLDTPPRRVRGGT
jgi:hypothetical protein